MFKVLAIGWTIALLAGFGLAVPAPGSADKTCNRTAPQPPQQLQQQPAPFIYILNPQRYRFKYPSDLFKTRGEHLFSQYRNPAEKGDSIAHLVETDDPSVQVAQLIAPSDNIQSRSPQTQTSTPTPPSFPFGSLPTLPPFSSVFPVSGAKCTTASGDNGVCLTQGDCDSQGGIKDGNCGTVLFASAGVCCSFSVKKCSDTAVRSPMTWVTPPRSFSSDVSCTLTFPSNPGLSVAGTTVGGALTSSLRTCQLKIEFISFRLAPPNPNTTVCEEDYFSVSGSQTQVPRLCGDSYTDQHMYLDYNDQEDDITLGFFINNSANKNWKLKITRIPCSSPQDLAPTSCLQYMTKEAGQVESFNFKQENPGSVRQLADQNYNICFKRSAGYCQTCFSPCPANNNVPGFLITKKDTGTGGTTGKSCADQLIIPGGLSKGIRESVFCGAVLNPTNEAVTDSQICTTSDRITYITDNTEDPETEANNAGFCLSYVQKKC